MSRLLPLAFAACLPLAAGLPPAAVAGVCDPELVPLRPPLLLPIEGPQDIAVDTSDGTLWVSFVLSNTVLHVNRDLAIIGSFEAPFAERSQSGVGGIAYNSTYDTIYLCQSVLREVWEVEKDGGLLGTIRLDLPAPPNIIPQPYPKGLAFNPRGDGGRGSLLVVEAVLTAVYEVSLEGEILGSFCHPDDPDGCPGEGRAAFSSDIDFHWQDGAPAGIELLGGIERRDRLHRLTLAGEPTGVTLPLAECGGRAGGFARGQALDPESGEPREVLFVTVESSAELHVFTTLEGEIRPLREFKVEARLDPGGAASVDLSWLPMQTYDSLQVLREGEAIASLPGDAHGYTDGSPPAGVLRYEVTARAAGCETRTSSFAVIGAGQVVASVPFDGRLPVAIAEDAGGLLWVTDAEENQLVIYDKDLNLVATLPSPFQGEEDVTGAIAYNPAADTFFIYNFDTNEVVEVDSAAFPVGAPFPSGVPTDPDDEAAVMAMLYNPAGNGGAGSFWYLDFTTGTLQERGRDGTLLGSCVHPDHVAEPPPDRTLLDAFAWGLSAVPGAGFAEFEVGGGRVRDRRSTRVLRLDAAGCTPTGFEIPLAGAAALGVAAVFGYHRTTHDGRPAAYVLSTSAATPLVSEVLVEPPPLPHLTGVACVQDGGARDVTITFQAHGGAESVEVARDGEPLATVAASAGSHVDRGAPEGFHTYALRAVKGELRSDDRRSSLRVGLGSVALRRFSVPPSAIHELAHDPVAGVYVAASIANRYSDALHIYGRGLDYRGEIPSPFRLPHQVAALAVRAGGAAGRPRSEIYCLGWLPGAGPGSQLQLPMRIVDETGAPLREFAVTPPRPRGNFVVFPSGMAWDAASDSFWYLERNTATVVHLSPAGEVLGSFAHPAPPFQDGVFNYGLAADGARGVLYLSTAGHGDYEITRIVEVTRGGRLTGFEVPVGDGGTYDRVRGFALDPDGVGIVAASGAGEVNDLVLHRAFGPLAPPRDLACAAAGPAVHLEWTNGEAYDAVAVLREGVEVAALGGAETSWLDAGAPARASLYRVLGRRGGETSAAAACEAAPDRPFLRGDVEENAVPNITDAVAILGYLFLGGTPPACPDAADVNDSGDVNITDPVALLNFLFLFGDPPAAPFPAAGLDPTPDSLSCPAGG